MAERLVGGRFELLDVVGSGAFGLVWRAYDWKHRKLVAVKIFASQSSEPELIHRFVQEQGFRLSHPNVLAPLDFFSDSERAALVMDLAEGGSLEELLAGGRPTLSTAVVIIEQLLDGVAYIHSQGILHRDIKPANVLLDVDEHGQLQVRLSDFGHALPTGGPRLTAPTNVVGTPGYIAPELYDNHDASPQSDLYSVGALAYQLLTGNQPAAPLHTLVATDPSVPEPLRPWLVSLTQPDPTQRPNTAQAALTRLHMAATNLQAFAPLAESRLPPAPRPRHQRRQRMKRIVASLAAVALITGTIATITLTRHANTNSKIAANLELLAATGQADAARGDLDTGLLLTSQAYLRSSTPQIRDDALQALAQRPLALVRYLTRTTGPINNLAVSSDHTLVAAAGDTISIFDLQTDRPLPVPAFADATGVLFSANGRRLVVTTDNHGVSIVDVMKDRVVWNSTGRVPSGFPAVDGLTSSRIGINAGGNILSVSAFCDVWVVDTASGHTIKLVMPSDAAGCGQGLSAMSPDGRQIADAQPDRIVLFNTGSGEATTIKWLHGLVMNETLRYTLLRGQQYLLDIVTGAPGAKSLSQTHPITSTNCSDPRAETDLHCVPVPSNGPLYGAVFMWDSFGHMVRHSSLPAQVGGSEDMGVSDDARFVAFPVPSTETAPQLKYGILDVDKGSTATLAMLPTPTPSPDINIEPASLTGTSSGSVTPQFLTDNQMVVVNDNSAVEYDDRAAIGDPSGLFQPIRIPGRFVTLAPWGQRGLARTGTHAIVYDTSDGKALDSISIPAGMTVQPQATTFSPDGTHLALTMVPVHRPNPSPDTQRLQLWDLQPLRLVTPSPLRCLPSAFSLDNAAIITYCFPSSRNDTQPSLNVYNANSGKLIYHNVHAQRVAESPDGHTIVVQNQFGSEQAISLQNGRSAPLRLTRSWWAIAAETSGSMSVSSDGTRALYVTQSGLVHLHSGSIDVPLPIDGSGLFLISPDGETAASIDSTGEHLQIWDLPTGQPIGPRISIQCNNACNASGSGATTSPDIFAFDQRDGDLILVDSGTPADTIFRMPITATGFRSVACQIADRNLTPEENQFAVGAIKTPCFAGIGDASVSQNRGFAPASSNPATENNGSACSATTDAARSASAVYYANMGGRYPTTFTELTTANPPMLTLPSNAIVAAGEIVGVDWEVTMSGGGATPPTFACH